VDGRFAALDADHDGLLTYTEMAGELMSLRVLEKHFGVDEATVPDELAGLYRSLFTRFDRDGSGKVDRHEFRAEMKEVMLAVANGLGFLPVQMVVEKATSSRSPSTGSSDSSPKLPDVHQRNSHYLFGVFSSLLNFDVCRSIHYHHFYIYSTCNTYSCSKYSLFYDRAKT
jgi:hypothetical protein